MPGTFSDLKRFLTPFSSFFSVLGKGWIEPGDYWTTVEVNSIVSASSSAAASANWKSWVAGAGPFQSITAPPTTTDSKTEKIGQRLTAPIVEQQVAVGTLSGFAWLGSSALAETTVTVTQIEFKNTSTGWKLHKQVFV